MKIFDTQQIYILSSLTKIYTLSWINLRWNNIGRFGGDGCVLRACTQLALVKTSRTVSIFWIFPNWHNMSNFVKREFKKFTNTCGSTAWTRVLKSYTSAKITYSHQLPPRTRRSPGTSQPIFFNGRARARPRVRCWDREPNDHCRKTRALQFSRIVFHRPWWLSLRGSDFNHKPADIRTATQNLTSEKCKFRAHAPSRCCAAPWILSWLLRRGGRPRRWCAKPRAAASSRSESSCLDRNKE